MGVKGKPGIFRKKLLGASKLRRGLSLGEVGFKELWLGKWTCGHILFAAIHGITFQMCIQAARGRVTDATAFTAFVAGVSAHAAFTWMISGSARPKAQTLKSLVTQEEDDAKKAHKDDEACADIIMVTSATTFQTPKMGSYVRTSISPGIRNAGRPVFKNCNGQYLSFDSSGGCWRMGPDYNKGTCALRSKRSENTWCPSRATGWEIFHHQDWHADPSISVAQVSFSVGDAVEVRDIGHCAEWKSAHVTSLRPLLVKVDGRSWSTSWDEVRQKVKPLQDEVQCPSQAERPCETSSVAADSTCKMSFEDQCAALWAEVRVQKTRSDALASQLGEATTRMEVECGALRAEMTSQRDRADALEKELATTKTKLDLAFVGAS